MTVAGIRHNIFLYLYIMLPHLNNLSPEERSLLLLCLPKYDRQDYALLEKSISEIKNWPGFAGMVNEHGIIALAYHQFKASGLLTKIPPVIMEKFRTGYFASLRRNTLIYKLFYETADIARNNGIKIIPVKGLLLEKTVYGDAGLRQMNDLDLLTSPEDAFKLRNLLLKEGYQSIPFISPIHSFFMHSYGKHMPEMIKDGLNVEIHFRLFGDKGNKITLDMVRLSKEAFPGENEILFSPPALYNFLYLVKHLVSHEKKDNSQLRLYCDLLFLLEKSGNEIINHNLYELARQAGILNELNRTLYLLRYFFGAVSGAPETDITTNAVLNFIRFLRQPKNDPAPDERGGFFGQIENIEGIHHKILYACGMLFPSLTFMKWRYNTKNRLQALLYYPRRWFDFARKLFK